MTKTLSAYTIAKNCTDLADVQCGINEIREYLNSCDKEGKKPTSTSLIRFSKLMAKKEKFKNS